MADRNVDEPGAGLPAEGELLHRQLADARDALIWKVEGLNETERRRPMTSTGTNLIGMVKHMTWIEEWYLCEFFGRERPRLEWDWDADGEWGHHSHMYAKPEETSEDLVATYRATTVAADRAIEDLGLDAAGLHWSGEEVTMRSMLHAPGGSGGYGPPRRPQRHHAELIDGRTGDRHSPSRFYGTSDEDYRSAYLSRVRGETDTSRWWEYIRTRGKRWS